MEKLQLKDFYASLQEEKNNLLNFYLENSIDRKNGGFYGEVDINNQPDPAADKSLILNSRILWSFSIAYRKDKKVSYKKAADRAYNYLLENFEDQKYGGFYWLLDSEGNPIKTKKQIYGQAFSLYALSEYFKAFNKDEALKKAVNIFALIENKSYDDKYGGYFEAYSREWSIIEDMSLSKKDLNSAKSMNTHLHILEAYTNLYRVWSDPELKEKLEELLKIILNKIIDQKNYRFRLFFDEKWDSKSETISFGHDIEGSWLIYEAAEILGEQHLLDFAEEFSLKMAAEVLENGRAEDGSIYYEFEDGKLDKDRHWWPQAEALVGFLNAYQLSAGEEFLEAALKVWNYTLKNLIDHEQGGWYWLISDQKKISKKAKINPWKSPYHNSRACYQAAERLETIMRK